MTDSAPPPLPEPPRRSLLLPLVLAFTPAVLVLVGTAINPGKGQFVIVCLPAAILSLGCCIASSIILFKRRTAAAVVFGILLALVNVAISLGLGCLALIGDMNLH
jgi:hypothetical protein